MASIDICYWWASVWRLLIFVISGQVYSIAPIDICYWWASVWRLLIFFIGGQVYGVS